MKCATCARDNPTGARYCVHCGAEQSVPTPIAAVAAAAMTSRGRGAMPQAANAAHADPAPDESASRSQGNTAPKVVTSRSEAPPKAAVAEHPRIAASPAVQTGPPAYASAPKRTGLAFSIVVACFVAAAATFFAWRMFAPDAFVSATAPADEGSSVMSALPPATSGARQNRSLDVDTKADGPARAPESARSPAPVAPADNTASRPPLQDANARAPADGSGTADNALATPEPVQITPLPAKPAPRPAKKSAPEREPQKVAAVPAAPVAPAPSTPAATAPSTTQAAASPRTAAVPDPWARMREELATCTREDFITRVVCGQRVRFRYCANYWGKVPECPGNPAPEHGQ